MLRYSSSALARAAAGRLRLVRSYASTAQSRHLGPGSSSFSSAAAAAGGDPDAAVEGAEASLRRRGVLDSDGLVKFSTLHELHKHSSEVFAGNQLFGTYTAREEGEGGDFVWMTYAEWGDRVDTCRAVLRDIGRLDWTSGACFPSFLLFCVWFPF